MNTLKRTLALVATLAMASTALASCGKDDSSSSEATTTASKASEDSSEGSSDAEPASDENGDGNGGSNETSTPNSTEVGAVTLKTGGDKFSVAAWNADDVPALLEAWEKKTGYSADKVNFINFDCGGGKAAEHYDALLASGDDLDVYFCEADWALKYINNDEQTAPLEALGFSDANFSDTYAYTNEIGRATSGANAGKMVGASWQCAAGGFAYRTDLAKEYLGVETPEDMQKTIEGWDNFVAAATKVAEASDKKVALADSLGGMWQVFAANRTQPWVEDGLLEIDDSCKVFADYAKTLWDNGGVTHNGQWTDAWIPAGKDGSCMGYFVSTWGFGEGAFWGQASSDSYGKWAVVQGPAPYFWGGTWIVVNPKTDNAEEAQTFILNSAVDPEAMKSYALSKPDYVNNKTVMQEIVDANQCPNEWTTKDLNGQNYFAELHENAKKINLKGLITPYDSKVKEKFLDAVQKEYCEAGADWSAVEDKVMTDVKAEISDLQ